MFYVPEWQVILTVPQQGVMQHFPAPTNQSQREVMPTSHALGHRAASSWEFWLYLHEMLMVCVANIVFIKLMSCSLRRAVSSPHLCVFITATASSCHVVPLLEMLAKWGFPAFYCSHSCSVQMRLLALVFSFIMLLPTVSLCCHSGSNGLVRQGFGNAQCSAGPGWRSPAGAAQNPWIKIHSAPIGAARLMFCKPGVSWGKNKKPAVLSCLLM